MIRSTKVSFHSSRKLRFTSIVLGTISLLVFLSGLYFTKTVNEFINDLISIDPSMNKVFDSESENHSFTCRIEEEYNFKCIKAQIVNNSKSTAITNQIERSNSPVNNQKNNLNDNDHFTQGNINNLIPVHPNSKLVTNKSEINDKNNRTVNKISKPEKLPAIDKKPIAVVNNEQKAKPIDKSIYNNKNKRNINNRGRGRRMSQLVYDPSNFNFLIDNLNFKLTHDGFEIFFQPEVITVIAFICLFFSLILFGLSKSQMTNINEMLTNLIFDLFSLENRNNDSIKFYMMGDYNYIHIKIGKDSPKNYQNNPYGNNRDHPNLTTKSKDKERIQKNYDVLDSNKEYSSILTYEDYFEEDSKV
mgnify:FL=1